MQEQETKLSRLRDHIKKGAFFTSDQHKIVSASGKNMGWICDMRKVMLKPEPLSLITDIIWEQFEKEYPFQICAQEMSGVPLVAALVLKSQQAGKPVNGFFLRKSRKTTGLQNIVEGEINNEKIILLDDVMNSGGTILRQAVVLEKIGKKVDSAFVLINFFGDRSVELIKKNQIRLISLFSPEEFGFSVDAESAAQFPKDSFRTVWNFQAPKPNFFYVIPKSSPCLDEQKVYFGSDNGIFWALNQESGAIEWKFEVGWPVPHGKTIFSSPAIYNDLIFFGSYDGNIYALEKKSGKLRWKFQEADCIGSSPAVSADLGMLFIGLEFGLFRKRGGIAALNLETGKKIWDYQMSEYVHCSPAYCPEKRVVAIGGNGHYAYMFNAKNGKLLWKFKTDGEIKSSFAFDTKRNLVLFGSFDQNLYALDIDTGEVKGKFETKDYIYSTPKVHGDNVYFTSTDKSLYSVNLETGKLDWRFMANGRIFSTPEIFNGGIFFGATDGKLYKLELPGGKFVSYFQTPERITNKIAINARTKKIFLYTYSNELFCLEEKTG